MIKTIWTFRFRDDLEPGAGLRHWRKIHAPLVLAAPGVTRYIQNVSIETIESGWDAVAETCFASREAYEEALASEIWARLAEDIGEFADVSSMIGAVVDDGSDG